jgi:hypothetical protein
MAPVQTTRQQPARSAAFARLSHAGIGWAQDAAEAQNLTCAPAAVEQNSSSGVQQTPSPLFNGYG